MKPQDKERLVRNRGEIIRSLDVAQIMKIMRQEKAFSSKDEDEIMSDPRRRQRAIRFLDILETKKTHSYEVFLDVLEEYYPHLYLAMIDWEDDDGLLREQENNVDEFTAIKKCRKFLIREMDAARLIDYLETKDAFSSDELKDVAEGKNSEERTEVFLDILECKPSTAHEVFIEAVGEVYPHLYLMLTDHDEDDNDDLF